MPTNIRENGFETLIVRSLIEDAGYEQGYSTEYSKEYAVDTGRLFRFLQATQPEKMQELRILGSDLETEKFLKHLDKKLKADGIIELLRKGIRYKHLKLDLYYVQPSNCIEPCRRMNLCANGSRTWYSAQLIHRFKENRFLKMPITIFRCLLRCAPRNRIHLSGRVENV